MEISKLAVIIFKLNAPSPRYDECTLSLREIYDDKDGLRKEEITALSGPNEFGEFYNRLKGIKEFHRRHPGEVRVALTLKHFHS